MLNSVTAKINSTVLGIAALSMNSKTYNAEVVCNVAFGSYMAGCVEVYRDKKLTDPEIIKIVAKCLAKAETFTKELDDCAEAKFE